MAAVCAYRDILMSPRDVRYVDVARPRVWRSPDMITALRLAWAGGRRFGHGLHDNLHSVVASWHHSSVAERLSADCSKIWPRALSSALRRWLAAGDHRASRMAEVMPRRPGGLGLILPPLQRRRTQMRAVRGSVLIRCRLPMLRCMPAYARRRAPAYFERVICSAIFSHAPPSIAPQLPTAGKYLPTITAMVRLQYRSMTRKI